MTWNSSMKKLAWVVFFIFFLPWGCNKNTPTSATAALESARPEPVEEVESSPKEEYFSVGGGGQSRDDYGESMNEENWREEEEQDIYDEGDQNMNEGEEDVEDNYQEDEEDDLEEEE